MLHGRSIVTETCDEAGPHLITTVETTPAPVNDVVLTPTIHTHLAARALLPTEHLLDAGSMAADVIVTSQQDHQVDLVGPVLPDRNWQAQTPGGLDVSCFAIDWDAQRVTCPAGKTSVRWTPGHDQQGEGQAIIAIQFAAADCAGCPLRARCTQAKTGPRTMKLRPRKQHESLQAARRQSMEAFKELYADRSGIEGTLSQGVRVFGLRYAKYIGLGNPLATYPDCGGDQPCAGGRLGARDPAGHHADLALCRLGGHHALSWSLAMNKPAISSQG